MEFILEMIPCINAIFILTFWCIAFVHLKKLRNEFFLNLWYIEFTKICIMNNSIYLLSLDKNDYVDVYSTMSPKDFYDEQKFINSTESR